jgi:hypothetical protein
LSLQWKESRFIMGQVVRGGEQFETAIAADYRGQIIRRGIDSGEVDAFARKRVSEPYTLFDSTMRYNKRPEIWNETIVGSSTSEHNIYQSSVVMSTTTASGDSVLRRTRRRFPYQPGKSLLTVQSFAGSVPASGLVQEVGLFDDDNGIMLRASGTTVQFVVRGKHSGVVTENAINQSEWNIDTAPWLDLSKANIFVADLEWLGAGRVRCGFMLDGEYYYCHEFLHANNIEQVYMTSAVLPQSYRIANVDTTASGATLTQICGTVMSEGGYEPYGEVYTVSPSIGSIANTSGERIVAGIRMASGRTDNVIIPVKVDLVTEDNTTIKWRLRRNPTTSGVTWLASDNGRGNVETTSAGTIVSGGTIVNAGLYFSAGSVAINVQDGLSLSLGVNTNNVSDELFLTVTSSGNAKATGMLGWIETL